MWSKGRLIFELKHSEKYIMYYNCDIIRENLCKKCVECYCYQYFCRYYILFGEIYKLYYVLVSSGDTNDNINFSNLWEWIQLRIIEKFLIQIFLCLLKIINIDKPNDFRKMFHFEVFHSFSTDRIIKNIFHWKKVC